MHRAHSLPSLRLPVWLKPGIRFLILTLLALWRALPASSQAPPPGGGGGGQSPSGGHWQLQVQYGGTADLQASSTGGGFFLPSCFCRINGTFVPFGTTSFNLSNIANVPPASD